jgi:hypothetical protein
MTTPGLQVSNEKLLAALARGQPNHTLADGAEFWDRRPLLSDLPPTPPVPIQLRFEDPAYWVYLHNPRLHQQTMEALATPDKNGQQPSQASSP